MVKQEILSDLEKMNGVLALIYLYLQMIVTWGMPLKNFSYKFLKSGVHDFSSCTSLVTSLQTT